MGFDELRRVLATRTGFAPAAGPPAASEGRVEEATTRQADRVERGPFLSRPVGRPTPCPEPMAFLDGVQRHELLGHVGHTLPVFAADIAAAIRERRGRHLVTVHAARQRLVLGRPGALARLPRLPRCRHLALPDDRPAHPILDRDLARAMVDRERSSLERALAAEYREREGGTAWLLVDGALAQLEETATDPRCLGISKSHSVLPFAGPELEIYLGLPAGHRTPVFQPATHGRPDVYSWGLRLREWVGRDVFFGLIRVEAAFTRESLARVDEYSRWLLAERAPLSAPDGRWDRLLYGIHNVEEYLRATLAVR